MYVLGTSYVAAQNVTYRVQFLICPYEHSTRSFIAELNVTYKLQKLIRTYSFIAVKAYC